MSATAPLQLLSGIIGQLRVHGDQLGDLDELTKETAKAKAKLDAVKRDLASWKQEIVEAKHNRDKYLAEAREKLAESERLDKEIKTKGEEVSALNDWINKIRQQLG